MSIFNKKVSVVRGNGYNYATKGGSSDIIISAIDVNNKVNFIMRTFHDEEFKLKMVYKLFEYSALTFTDKAVVPENFTESDPVLALPSGNLIFNEDKSQCWYADEKQKMDRYEDNRLMVYSAGGDKLWYQGVYDGTYLLNKYPMVNTVYNLLRRYGKDMLTALNEGADEAVVYKNYANPCSYIWNTVNSVFTPPRTDVDDQYAFGTQVAYNDFDVYKWYSLNEDFKHVLVTTALSDSPGIVVGFNGSWFDAQTDEPIEINYNSRRRVEKRNDVMIRPLLAKNVLSLFKIFRTQGSMLEALEVIDRTFTKTSLYGSYLRKAVFLNIMSNLKSAVEIKLREEQS